MGFSSTDVNKIKGEFLKTAADLLENVLSHPPSRNIAELWKEHQHVRKTLEEISAKQALLGDTDKRLSDTRSLEDLTCFLTWADNIGIKRFGVTVAECREVDGLGLLAETNISKKSRCLTVPRHAIISTDLAMKSGLKDLFERDSIVRNMANVGLALVICAQKVKSDSRWTPYLKVLPSVYTTPLFYTEEELQKQKAKVQPPPMYSSPFTVVNFTFSLYRWSVGTVTTRINLIPSEETRTDSAINMVPALIPMLDMANHEAILGTDALGEAVSYSVEDDCAELLSSKSMRAGEWLSMFYGRRSCAEHLLHNGFIPSGDNPFDSYKLKICLGRSDRMFKEKQKIFVEMGFGEDSNVYMHDVSLGPQPFHPSLEHFARVYVADNLEGVSEPKTLRKAVHFLKDRFAILERAYGTIAEGETPNESNMGRLKKAEVAILKNARIYCEEWEKRLSKDVDDTET